MNDRIKMKNAKPEVLITADRTLMTTHHDSEFLGFATCIPAYPIPTFLAELLFFPPVKCKHGIPIYAPYGMRKVEASLLNAGINVSVVDPDYLASYLKTAKILMVSTMDPFGWGPASSTFMKVLRKGDVFSSIFLRKIFESKEVRAAKERGVKILLGGPGAWEFRHAPEMMDKYGIDSVIMGESEKVLPRMVSTVLRNENTELPRFVEAAREDTPTLEEIPEIQGASVNGLVEVGRGCPRGCKFCEVTLRKLRWYPLEKIEQELKVNNRCGKKSGIIHGEDILLYGVRGIKPDIKKLRPMFRLFADYCTDGLSWSHTSIAAVSSCPEAIELADELFINELGQKWFGVEIGIETGSPDLIARSMPAKSKPFKPEEWQGLVKNSLGILQDHHIVPACTLITGLPDETEGDTIKTLELIDDIKEYRALIVPLFFVPMGKLKNKDWFSAEEVTDLQKELLSKCLVDGITHARDFARDYNQGHFYSPLLNRSLRGFIDLIEFIGKRKNLI